LPWPMLGWPPWSNPVGRCATARSWPPPTPPVSPWCWQAVNGTSATETPREDRIAASPREDRIATTRTAVARNRPAVGTMTATLLDGERLAARIRAEITDRVARLAASGVAVGLGTILVGDDAPSARYVAMKHEDCAEVGIHSAHEHLPADVPQAELQ